jgi:DNA-binding beta-propeller fold protein YncE
VTLTYSTIAAGPLGLWAASQVHTLDRIAQSGFGIPQVTKRVPVERTPYEDQSHDMLADVAVGETAVWASGGLQEHAVFRVDPRTDAVTRLPLPSATGSIAVGAGAVWVAGPAEDVLWRLDPVAGRVTDTIPVCRGPAAVSVDERGVWLACAVYGTIVLVDPGVRRVAETIEVGGRPWAIAGGGDALWVASRAD